MVAKLKGVVAPVLTPFNDDMSIAEDLFLEHAAYLLENGCVGLAPFGTTGEALSIGLDERLDMLERMVESGIDPARLIPGTGLSNLPDTVHLTKHAMELGCEGAMVLPPFYYKTVTDEGLFSYFAKLIETVGEDETRLYLYHIPQVAGVGLSIDLVARLKTAYPGQVAGIKDSSGNWGNTKTLLEIDGLVVYPSAESVLPEAIALGAAGCITATSNTNAADLGEIAREIFNGRSNEVAAKLESAKAYRALLQEHDFISGQKWLMANSSGDPRWKNVRPPLVPLSAEMGESLHQKLS